MRAISLDLNYSQDSHKIYKYNTRREINFVIMKNSCSRIFIAVKSGYAHLKHTIRPGVMKNAISRDLLSISGKGAGKRRERHG